MSEPQTFSGEAVLICGLGRLGQHCAALLKEFGIPVFGITDREVEAWEVEGMPELLDRVVIGDGRRHAALLDAGIKSCRAILLTTRDESSNVSAALAARALNPDIRLVVRSSQANLNNLLHQQLGNLIALDTAELPATAFALAAIGDETVGLFSVDGQLLRVVEDHVTASHPWCESVELRDLNTRTRRVLHRTTLASPKPIDFQDWDSGGRIAEGDLVLTIRFNEPSAAPSADEDESTAADLLRNLRWSSLRSRIAGKWAEIGRPYKLGALIAAILIVIHLVGAALYRLRYPEISLLDAFNVATVLIFDGYSNMFAQLKLPFPIPLWLLLFSLLMTMSGAIVTGILYAFLTTRVLSARLHFRRKHGRVPRANHVVVVGTGLLERRVAELLGNLGRPVVCIDDEEPDADFLPGIPLITGDRLHGLEKANSHTAASVAVMTEDDMANLEIALMAARHNERSSLVIRTDDAEFGRNVESLAPRTRTMSTYALSAEAFAAASLGEKVLSLLRIRNQTVLAIEYSVEEGDTLTGRLIADVMYGYGVVAIFYQRDPSDKATFFPSEDLRLEIGGRLVVLATIAGVRNVEHGALADRRFRVRLLRAISQQAAFEGARVIARVTGCDMGTSRTGMGELPATLSLALYRQQAQRLVRELKLAGVEAEVTTANEGALKC